MIVLLLSNDNGQISFIFLHRPFSRSFNSRPPWDKWKFGDKEWTAQITAGACLDAMIGFENYIHRRSGDTINVEPTSASFLYQVLFKIYIATHFHGDTQIAALFQKDVSTEDDKKMIKPLKHCGGSFRTKHANKHERRRSTRGNSTGAKNMLYAEDIVSCFKYDMWNNGNITDAAVQQAANIIMYQLDGIRRRPIHTLSMLKRLEQKYFEERTSIFSQLYDYIIEEHDTLISSQKKDRMDNTFNEHLTTLTTIARDMKNWESDEEGDYHLLIPGKKNDLRKYLNALKDRNCVGDDEKRAILEEFGWTWDILKRNEALVNRTLRELQGAEEDARDKAEQEEERMGRTDMQQTMGNMTSHGTFLFTFSANVHDRFMASYTLGAKKSFVKTFWPCFAITKSTV